MEQQKITRTRYSRMGTPGLCHVGAADPGELNYNPVQLIEMVSDHLGVKNDAQLCRMLEVHPPLISKIRNKRLPVTAELLLTMHDATGLTITDLRFLMGDKRKYFRPIELLEAA